LGCKKDRITIPTFKGNGPMLLLVTRWFIQIKEDSNKKGENWPKMKSEKL
jgi:hypothetical protein